MLRFLIAQAVVWVPFLAWKYDRVKPTPVPQPYIRPELVQIGEPSHSVRSTVVRQKYERIPLTPKQRFEILKRDGFTCQYCGRKPPEVVLNVDHIIPVVPISPEYKSGINDPSNLITSCKGCNEGKSNIPLEKD